MVFLINLFLMNLENGALDPKQRLQPIDPKAAYAEEYQASIGELTKTVNPE